MNLFPLRLLGASAICLSVAVAGCATWQTPQDVSDAALRSRAVTGVQGDVRIEATVLSAADTRRMLGSGPCG